MLKWSTTSLSFSWMWWTGLCETSLVGNSSQQHEGRQRRRCWEAGHMKLQLSQDIDGLTSERFQKRKLFYACSFIEQGFEVSPIRNDVFGVKFPVREHYVKSSKIQALELGHVPLAFCSEAMDLHTRNPTCLIPAIQRRVESRTRTEAGYCEKTLFIHFIQLFSSSKKVIFWVRSKEVQTSGFNLLSHLITPATNPSMKLRRLRDDIFRELFLNFFCCCVPFLEHQKLQNQQHTTFKLHLTMPMLVFSLVKWKIDRSLGL